VRSQAAFVPARWANHPVVRLFSRRRIHKPLLNFNSSSVLISSILECRSTNQFTFLPEGIRRHSVVEYSRRHRCPITLLLTLAPESPPSSRI
jgi:hypothetical protein